MDYNTKYPQYDPPFQRFAPSSKRFKRPGKLATAAAVILGFGTILTILNIYELGKLREDHALHLPISEATAGKFGIKQPVVWMEGKHLYSGYLKHVFAVFDRIGYAVGDSESDWDVMWSHEYPFEQWAKKLSDLKPHQRVNHFPGTGFITNKVSLATSENPYIPKAFKIPKQKDQLLSFAKQHPDTLWVQKRNSHRGIKIKKIDELDLVSEGSFVQEYVDKPLLINKKKFDIGVYTILTSISPLRVYIVGESLFRFCTHDYYPFDYKDTKKYVVDDNYLPMWNVPSLKSLYSQKVYTFKESFDTYLQQQGKNHTKLWDDIKKAIQTVYLQKESSLISSTSRFKSLRNFFEMVRFDFVLDESLNVYLMEVNMSPNLSSGHFSSNKKLYEHVIFNMLHLVGVTRPATKAYELSEDDDKNMRASSRDITVFPDWCTSTKCQEGCASEMCKLCHQCMTTDTIRTLKYAYMEHVNKGDCHRVFPPPMKQEVALKWTPDTADITYKSLKKKNRVIYAWFVGKCRIDASWCV